MEMALSPALTLQCAHFANKFNCYQPARLIIKLSVTSFLF